MKRIILHLVKYFKSEEFIFDIILVFFILIFNSIIPHSRDEFFNLVHHSFIIEFIVSVGIQSIVAFNFGRYLSGISNRLMLYLAIMSLGFLFLLLFFPAFIIEQHSEYSILYIILIFFLNGFVMFMSMILGFTRGDMIFSKKENKKVVVIFFIALLTAFSVSTLILYQRFMIEELKLLGMDTESVVSILFVTIVSGLVPFRLLLLIKKPFNYFGAFIGIIVLFLDIFADILR